MRLSSRAKSKPRSLGCRVADRLPLTASAERASAHGPIGDRIGVPLTVGSNAVGGIDAYHEELATRGVPWETWRIGRTECGTLRSSIPAETGSYSVKRPPVRWRLPGHERTFMWSRVIG
jgi:hypothetical protein